MSLKASPQRKLDHSSKDFFQTPHPLTRLLLENEVFDGTILEPAAGKGAIVKVLKDFDNKEIVAYDLDDNNGKDFLTEDRCFSNIITNPPFKLAHQFILHSKQLANQKIAMLLPLNYLHGQKRFNEIWTDTLFPLASVYIFTRYVMFDTKLRKDDKLISNGFMTFAWFVWDKKHQGPPAIKWLPIEKKDIATNKKKTNKERK